MLLFARFAICASLLAVAPVADAQGNGHSARSSTTSTVVSLTFDDGSSSPFVAARRLRRHGV